ncbi:MAG TPA: M23 family metallopeptidase [Terriglobales bacterium]|nr:M23 family metallopeptidase [Terriglobales bacterium]
MIYRPQICVVAAILFFLLPAGVRAQACRVTPSSVKLGYTIRLTCPRDVASAKMGERIVPLFPQPDGSAFGLMPVSVNEKLGVHPIQFLSAEKKLLFTAKAIVLKTYFPSQDVTLSPSIEALHSTTEDIHLLVAFRDTVSDERFWKDPLAPPVSGCMTSPFGVKRLHNGKPTGEYHSGVDQRTPEGEPIRAVAAGTVKFAQKFNVLGNAIGMDHGQGLETIYLHMEKLAVEKGARVDKGTILGYAGETGRANGPHLHWALYANGVHVNPAQWVKLTPCPRERKQR